MENLNDTDKTSENADKELRISDVSSSDTITLTKEELETFLKEWSAGYQEIYDAGWDEKSLRIVKFLGLED